MSVTTQSRACLLPCHQRKARLHGQAEVCLVDVHVSSRSAEGVGVHEGASTLTCFSHLEDANGSQVLHEHDFPVPRPIDQARHTILMEFIDAYPLFVQRSCRLPLVN